MNRKVKAILVLLIIGLIVCTGCAQYADKFPQIKICRSKNSLDNICIPLKDGYIFSDDSYIIEETDLGYDVIVHAIKSEEQNK